MKLPALTKDTREALYHLAWAVCSLLVLGSYVTSSPHSSLEGLTLVHHGTYLEISVPDTFQTPATTTGMYLVARNKRIATRLGPGAENFVQGSSSVEAPVILRAGETAYISPGISPTGTSFRVNECSGYLSQFQEFTPPLPTTCALPKYTGKEADCAAYVKTLPECEIIYNDTRLSKLSRECRSFIVTEFNYNSCRNNSEHMLAEWRMYAPGIFSFENEPLVDLYDAERRLVGTFTQHQDTTNTYR